MSNTTWEEFEEIFNLNAKGPQGLAPEDLADITHLFRQTYEITINFKRDGLTDVEHLNAYKAIWEELEQTFRTEDSRYMIESCVSGQIHLHGFLILSHPIQVYDKDDLFFLKMIAKKVFMLLPRKYWRQYTTGYKIDGNLRRFKSPAVCINMKNVLSDNWVKYIEKNAPKF